MSEIERMRELVERQKQMWRELIKEGAVGQAELVRERLGDMMSRLFVMEEQNAD